MPVNARGMTATTDLAASDLVVDMSSKLLLLEPDKNQFMKFVSKLRKAPTKATTFSWQDDQIVQFSDTLSAAIVGAGDATITVSNKDRWLPNDLALIPSTGEIVKVTAASGSGAGTISITRGAGGTAAAAASGAVLVKVGSSWGEGSSTRDASNNIISLETVKNNNFNYTQVEKTVCSQTATQIAVGQSGGLYSGDPRKHQQMLKGMEHAKKKNNTCYFGKRAIAGNDRKTGGMIEFITTTAATTSLTQANIDADLGPFFRNGNSKKTLFTTRRVASKISANMHVQMVYNDSTPAGGDIDKGSTYGARVRTYVGDSGEFDVVIDNSLSDIATYAGYGLFIDDTEMGYRFLPGRDDKLVVDAQLADVDGKVDYYITEWGLQRGLAGHHAMWTSVAA